MRHRYSGPLFIVLYEILWGGGWGQFRKRDGDLVIMIHVWIQLFRVIFFFFLIFWPCGILVPRPGIEPTPHALEEWSLNHWATRDVPTGHF